MTIVTANELLSGATVYLAPDGQFREDLQGARVFSKDETEALDAALEAARATGRLLSLETEAVTVESGIIVPQRLRERIRAQGPTAPRHARQTLDEDSHVSL